MGNNASLITFKENINQLVTKTIDRQNHEYWRLVFTTPLTKDNLFQLLSPDFIRSVRDKQPENIAIILFKSIEQLSSFSNNAVVKSDSTSANNSILLLMRILPFVFEHNNDAIITNLFEHNKIGDQVITKIGKNELKEPLGKMMIEVLLRSLFLPKFTIPERQWNADIPCESKAYPEGLNMAHCWTGGLGAPASAFWTPTEEQRINRSNIMKCLISCYSSTVYCSFGELANHRNHMIEFTIMNDSVQKEAAHLFFSLWNTALSYNPTTLLPYTSQWMSDPQEEMTLTATHLLVLLTHYQPPLSVKDAKKNVFRHFLSQLSRTDDVAVVFEFIAKLLGNAVDANNTYLPGSQRMIDFQDEMVSLFWQTFELCGAFRHYAFDKDIHRLFSPLLFIFQLHAKDTTRYYFEQLCAYIFLSLSQYRAFAMALNKPYVSKLPVPMAFYGESNADFVICLFHKLIASDRGVLKPITNILLTVLQNVSPYLKKLNIHTASKLVHLFQQYSRVSYLYSQETHWQNVDALLVMFNNLIQYQYHGNISLVYAILSKKQIFLQLNKKAKLEVLVDMANAVHQRRREKNASLPETPSFVPTADWLASWKPRLPLRTIVDMIQYFSPRIDMESKKGTLSTESDLMEFIQNDTLVGVVPTPPQLLIRTFSSTSIHRFLMVYYWSLIYMRNVDATPLFDTSKIKLFEIHEASSS